MSACLYVAMLSSTDSIWFYYGTENVQVWSLDVSAVRSPGKVPLIWILKDSPEACGRSAGSQRASSMQWPRAPA